MGSSTGDASLTITLNLTAPSASAQRDVLMSGNTAVFSPTRFSIPEVGTIPVRVLIDRTLAEIFVAEGRGVVTVPISASGNKTNAFLVSGPIGVKVQSIAWDMNCGWAKYP